MYRSSYDPHTGESNRPKPRTKAEAGHHAARGSRARTPTKHPAEAVPCWLTACRACPGRLHSCSPLRGWPNPSTWPTPHFTHKSQCRERTHAHLPQPLVAVKRRITPRCTRTTPCPSPYEAELDPLASRTTQAVTEPLRTRTWSSHRDTHLSRCRCIKMRSAAGCAPLTVLHHANRP
jgi:hypothetical protein